MLLAVTSGALVALVLGAAWWDLHSRRIPSVLSLSGVVVALALRTAGGTEAIVAGALGLAIAFIFAVPLFAAGGLGGGDVKLLGAVGAFLGPGPLVTALLVTAIVGGVMALVLAWRRGLLADSLAHAGRLAARLVPMGNRGPIRTLATPGALAIPYAVPIAIGALVGWFA
jgi:prepilin peptidase CpaA